MFIVGLSMVISKSSREGIEKLVKDHPQLLGLISIMIGMPIVILHNKWTGIWEITVTIMAWGSVIKGFARILNHPTLNKIRENKLSGNSMLIASWGALIFSFVLIYGAYYA